ncbi:MAG: serine hydrolase [Bacteroidia bacterium]|nr:serine hydrolase [Bacteroidia bacterium]
MTRFLIICTALFVFVTGCQDDDGTPPVITDPGNTELYFPETGSSDWETISPSELGWDTSKIEALLSFLDQGDTRAFMVLKNGKIVLEHYAGKDLLNLGDFGRESQWYWASAGKTLTAFLVGQAQEDGYLDIMNPTSDYLGKWTELIETKENKITVRHQLTMTSGLDDSGNSDCTDKNCLTYKEDAGQRWAYHNAPYTLLDSVIQHSTQQSFDNYFNKRLRDPIGMEGAWRYLNYNHVYFSNARSMARFGLLVLNKGKWKDTPILADKQFFDQMVSTSQGLNKSYGYLWWLNGKESHRLPGLQINFPGPITKNAPNDMVAAMGKNGQLLNIVPSQNLVVLRLGDNPDISLVPTRFQNDLWEKLNDVIQ